MFAQIIYDGHLFIPEVGCSYAVHASLHQLLGPKIKVIEGPSRQFADMGFYAVYSIECGSFMKELTPDPGAIEIAKVLIESVEVLNV